MEWLPAPWLKKENPISENISENLHWEMVAPEVHFTRFTALFSQVVHDQFRRVSHGSEESPWPWRTKSPEMGWCWGRRRRKRKEMKQEWVR